MAMRVNRMIFAPIRRVALERRWGGGGVVGVGFQCGGGVWEVSRQTAGRFSRRGKIWSATDFRNGQVGCLLYWEGARQCSKMADAASRICLDLANSLPG